MFLKGVDTDADDRDVDIDGDGDGDGDCDVDGDGDNGGCCLYYCCCYFCCNAAAAATAAIIIIIVLICITCPTNGLATANIQSKELSISECAAKVGECDESKGRPVCGTDDQTYSTRCHLLRVQCSGHEVSIKYRGPCKACIEAREYALKHRPKNSEKFIPRCRPDGTYALVQCLTDTGCWCSDITGKPIKNTSVRTGKPKCRGYNKANIRRSPSHHLASNRRPTKRLCHQQDRITFNNNLFQQFQSEYLRMQQQQQQQQQQIADKVADRHDYDHRQPSAAINSHRNRNSTDILLRVYEWKFANLDANTNGILDKNEYREVKKLIKRAVKPRRCARTFGKFCDVDGDERLTLLEWKSCLAKDGINPIKRNTTNLRSTTHYKQRNRHLYNQQIFTMSNPQQYHHHHHHHDNHHNHHRSFYNNKNDNNLNNGSNRFHTDLLAKNNTMDYDDDDDDADGDVDDPNGNGNGESDGDGDYEYTDDEDDHISYINAFGASTKFPSIHFLIPKSPDASVKETEGESGCLADKAAALEEQNHSNTLTYVPDCTANGDYQRIQCYRSTPYCWCVNEETGKSIPGTLVKNRRPQCDTIYTFIRPMKGCPEPKKTAFLKDLKDYLKLHLIAGSHNVSNLTQWSSEDERIASLSFVILDKDRNKSWERKEWKIFRELIMNSKTLRKCGKKLPRYCDANGDKKITLTEWLNCLQASGTSMIQLRKDQTMQNNESVTSKPLKLTGSNPLEQYLKD